MAMIIMEKIGMKEQECKREQNKKIINNCILDNKFSNKD